MARVSREQKKEAYLGKARAELDALAARGVRMGGNAFSQVLLVKSAEANGAEPFSAADGAALKASLAHLGYAPEDWEWLLTTADDGAMLAPELLAEALAALDPSTVILADEASARAVCEAYAQELSQLADYASATLAPGTVVRLRGMRVASLGNFADMLASDALKQRAWAQIKKLTPLAEPY